MRKRFALLLANPVYHELRLSGLPLPGEGASQLEQFLRDPEGGAFNSVETVTHAGLSQTLAAVERFFANKSPDDFLLVWFGGHAAIDTQGDAYLMLQDSDRLRLKSSAIMAGVLAMHMDSCPSRQKLLLLDTRFHAFVSALENAPFQPTLKLDRAFAGRGNSKHVICSDTTLHIHSLLDSSSANHAVPPFTRALIAVWREEIEVNGEVTLEQLFLGISRRLGTSTHPDWIRLGDASDLVIQSIAPQAVTVTAGSTQMLVERTPRNLDALDWEHLSGEVPLEILGLGLVAENEPTVESGNLYDASLTGDGPLTPPTPPSTPTPPLQTGLGITSSPPSGHDTRATHRTSGSPENPPGPPHAPLPFGLEDQHTLAMPTPEALAALSESIPEPALDSPAPGAAFPDRKAMGPGDALGIRPSDDLDDLMNRTMQISIPAWITEKDEPPKAFNPHDTVTYKIPEGSFEASPLSEVSHVELTTPVDASQRFRAELASQQELEAEAHNREAQEIAKQEERLRQWKATQAAAKPHFDEGHNTTAAQASKTPTDDFTPISLKSDTFQPKQPLTPENENTIFFNAEDAEDLKEAAKKNALGPKANPTPAFLAPNDEFAPTLMYIQEETPEEMQAAAAAKKTTTKPHLPGTSVYHPPSPEPLKPSVDRFENKGNPKDTLPPSGDLPFTYSLEKERLAWGKLALIALCVALPLSLSAVLLKKSGLFNRLAGSQVQAMAPLPMPSPPSATLPTVEKTPTPVPVVTPALSPTPVHLPTKALVPAASTPPVTPSKPEPKVEAENRALKVALHAVLQREAETLSAIYDRYSLGYPNLRGQIFVQIQVAPDGRILQAHALRSNTGVPRFDQDVAISAHAWKLSPFSGTRPKLITVPLQFPLNPHP